MSKHPDNSGLAPATLEVGRSHGGCVFIEASWDGPNLPCVALEYTKADALRLIRKLIKEVERIEANEAEDA